MRSAGMRPVYIILIMAVAGVITGLVLAACTPPTPVTQGTGSKPSSVNFPNAACGTACDPNGGNICGTGMICKTDKLTGESTCQGPWCPSIVGFYPPACGMSCSADYPCAAGLGCADGICKRADGTCANADPLAQCFQTCDTPGTYVEGWFCLGDATSANWYNAACSKGVGCWDPCVPVELGGKGCSDGFACEGDPSVGYMCNTASCAACASPCKLDAQCSSLGSDAKCEQGQCRASICNQAQPTLPPAAVNPCADKGGMSFQGDICVYPGVIDTVTMCADGTKIDFNTGQACVPTESCDQGGTTSSDTGSTSGGTGGCVPTGTDCGSCVPAPDMPQGGICTISCGSCKP